jgi:hypothetical protein
MPCPITDTLRILQGGALAITAKVTNKAPEKAPDAAKAKRAEMLNASAK